MHSLNYQLLAKSNKQKNTGGCFFIVIILLTYEQEGLMGVGQMLNSHD
jgi:hypothetical protein